MVLSLHTEENLALRAIQAGADGYLRKDCTAEEVLVALRKLVKHGKHVSPEVMERLLMKVSHPGAIAAPHEKLSDREYQVMCHLARGLALTEIATRLSLSPNTISTYRARILDKLGIDNNAALTRYAIAQQLID